MDDSDALPPPAAVRDGTGRRAATAVGEVGRCSFVADADGDPQEGAAPHVEQWFIAEHLGPWGPRALPEPDIAPRAAAAITAWAGRNRGWTQVVRMPGQQSREVPPMLRAARAAARHSPRRRRPRPNLGVLPPRRVPVLPRAGAAAARLPVRRRPAAGGARAGGALRPGVARPAVAAWARQVLAAGRRSRRPSTMPGAATEDLRRDPLLPVVTTRLDDDVTRVVVADPDCIVTVAERRVPVDRPLTCSGRAPIRMRVFDLVPVDR